MVKLSELLSQTDAPLVVSGCLAGLKCRYDGQSKPVEAVRRLVEAGRAVTICPEMWGGLPTPRPASGIRWCPSGVNVVSPLSDKASDAKSDNMSVDMSDAMSDVVSVGVSDAKADAMSDAMLDAMAGELSESNPGAAVWRNQAELVNREGRLVTDNYKRGAQLALKKARSLGSKVAILKQHSPSCGVGSTGGADPWQRLQGDGVTAALFKSAGLIVVADEEVEWDA